MEMPAVPVWLVTAEALACIALVAAMIMFLVWQRDCRRYGP